MSLLRGTWIALVAETYRLTRSRSTWWSAVFLAVVAAARVLAARAADAVQRAEAIAQGRTVTSSSGLEEGIGWAPFVDGWRTGLTAATLLFLLHAARSVAADRESGVLRATITRSSSRTAAVLARALVALPAILGAFAITGAAAFASSAALFDFGPLVEDGYELLGADEVRAELVTAALATLPALVATYAFGLLVSAALRSASAAVAIALSLFLAFDLFKDALGEAHYWVFAAFAPSFVDGSALSEMSGVARGYSDAGFSQELVRMGLLLPWPQAALLVGLACWAVSRRAA